MVPSPAGRPERVFREMGGRTAAGRFSLGSSPFRHAMGPLFAAAARRVMEGSMGAVAVNFEAGDCTGRAPLSGWRRAESSWRDLTIALPGFRTEAGSALSDPKLRLRLHGDERLPPIVVAGGFSAGRRVADAGFESGWWREVVRADGPIDTARCCLVGFDFLPGDEPEALVITPADQARALACALDEAGIGRLRAYVGASYGGFIGLSLASLFPDRVEKLVTISAAARPDPMTTALRGVQRRIIRLALDQGRPEEGVALARELAMTTYRTAAEFRTRFEARPRGDRPGDPFDVCDYLVARGKAYARAVTAQRYLTLSDSLDRADADLSAIRADCLFIAATGDRLVPAEDTEAAAAGVSGGSAFHCFESVVGHDAFLCDPAGYAAELKAFLEESR